MNDCYSTTAAKARAHPPDDPQQQDDWRCPTFISFEPPVSSFLEENEGGFQSRTTAAAATTVPSFVPHEHPSPQHVKRSYPTEYYDPYDESALIRACKNREWKKVLRLCETNPEMACPQPIYDADDHHHHTYPDIVGCCNHVDRQTIKRDRKDNDNDFLGNAASTAASTATPIPTASTAVASLSSSFSSPSAATVRPNLIHEETALGIVCSMLFEGDQQQRMMHKLVRALIRACPKQTSVCQIITGHTALRDLVRNPSCTTEVLRLFFFPRADLTHHQLAMSIASYHLPDQVGLTPMDYLILNIHCNHNKEYSLELFQSFVDMMESHENLQEQIDYYSSAMFISPSPPLIRLLSLGDSRDDEDHQLEGSGLVFQSPLVGNGFVPDATTRRQQMMDTILQSVRCLIQRNPNCLHQLSKTSGCTALHVALRNYGNCPDLIRLLLDQDNNNNNKSDNGHFQPMVTRRNVFGDLPLHVACMVGAPMEVLRILLDTTLAASPQGLSSPHPLLWSSNHAGRTPIDLEWMRHIEGGKGLYESRSFYPLEERGIHFQNGRQEEMYHELLSDAVKQIMRTNKTMQNNRAFGVLLDRIVLLVQMANRQCPTADLMNNDNNNDIVVVSTDHLLHAVSTLMTTTTATTTSSNGNVGTHMNGPVLPEPFFNLFFWMHGREQINRTDDKGRLPLHCALAAIAAVDTDFGDTPHHDNRREFCSASSIIWNDTHEHYSRWINTLIEAHPRACMFADFRLRLPLHYFLDNPLRANNSDQETSNNNNNNWKRHKPNHKMAILCKLVDAFPDSVERRDPVSGLYPFLQAAENPCMSLEASFFLLRRAPALLSLSS